MTAYAEVIGDPIAHSRSPVIHRFWLDRLGIDGDYRASRVEADALPAYLAERRRDANWRGCNITIPHKEAALPLVDAREDDGIGAINCVIPSGERLVGRNTDVGGLQACLPPTLSSGDRVLLIGAGGAAAAAIAALRRLELDCELVVRRPEQARALLARFGVEAPILSFDEAPEAMAGAAGVLNASPLGMDGFPPMPEALLHGLSNLPSQAFVLDMVYAPLRTALLEASEKAGHSTVDGLAMLIGQAGLAFSFFFGAEAPRELDDELRALLVR